MENPQTIADWITAAGIRCRAGYYPRTAPILNETVAVVHRKQIRNGRELFSVTVAVPPMLPEGDCEASALQIYRLLTEHGGTCTLEASRYDAKSDRYLQEVTAYWEEPEAPVIAPEIEVSVGSTRQQGVIYCCSQRIYTEDKDEPGHYIGGNWEIELRQENAVPTLVSTSTFTLTVTMNGATESFRDCRWIQTRLERTEKGAVLIRKCVSPGRTLS